MDGDISSQPTHHTFNHTNFTTCIYSTTAIHTLYQNIASQSLRNKITLRKNAYSDSQCFINVTKHNVLALIYKPLVSNYQTEL